MTKKEKIQYVIAIGTLISGILLCYLSFFLNEQHIVHDSVLWYFGETAALAGTLMGFNVFVKNELKSFSTRINNQINDRIRDYHENKIEDE